MKALVFNDIGDIGLKEVSMPKIKEKTDAIVRITMSAICGTDLHFIRGTVGPMKSGTILGHEAVGIVEEVGEAVSNFKEGDRVIIPSTIACGICGQCRKANYSQCDQANPNGPEAGTCFFGGPKSTGPINGCQAEFVRVPYAANNLIRLSDEVSDDQAILLSDIFPTAYFATDIAKVKAGDVVVVLGCGPVGLFAIASSILKGSSQVFAIDTLPSRLALAKKLGAQVINFNEVNPVEKIKEATGGNLADVVIDAVGVDAVHPTEGPGAKEADKLKENFKQELNCVAPKTNIDGDNWNPGSAPSQALRYAVDMVKKCGRLSIIGVYPQTLEIFQIGKAMNKNLTLVMGNCPHRLYIPKLLNLVQAGLFDPTQILSQEEPFVNIVEAYKNFDRRESGWIKVALLP